MGLRCSFDVIDDFGYPEEVEDDEYGIIVPVDYSEGCAVFTDIFLSLATSYVPVDTGYLQSTLEADSGDSDCECWTDCEYAQYVEYGTIYQMAQPYFEPAVERALAMASPLWDAALAEANEELAAEVEEAAEEEAEEEMDSMQSRETSFGFGGVFELIGSLLAALAIIAIATIAIEFIKDTFGNASGRGVHGFEEGGQVFMPEIEIY